MSNKYVVKKEKADGRRLYLHPDLGFCVERSCGGVYTFISKSTAKNQLVYANKYRWSGGESTDTIMTYEEYLEEREAKLDRMESRAKEMNLPTHREENRMYVYIVGQKFGKLVAVWDEVTLNEEEEMDNFRKFL